MIFDVVCVMIKKFFIKSILNPRSHAKRLRCLKDWKCMNCQPSSAGNNLKSSDSTALTKQFLLRILEDFKKDIIVELRTFRKEYEEVSTMFLSNALCFGTGYGDICLYCAWFGHKISTQLRLQRQSIRYLYRARVRSHAATSQLPSTTGT